MVSGSRHAPVLNGAAKSSNGAGPNGLPSGTGAKRSLLKPLGAVVFFVLLYCSLNIAQKAPEAMISSAVQPYTKAVGGGPNYSADFLSQREFTLIPPTELTPKICWLMSFPNSGTSYTMTMVARASERAFATNYADEVTYFNGTDTPSIYPRYREGPYWAGLSGKIATPRPLPDNYVLTKTHCGSRCIDCGPDEYVETKEKFLQRCASGHGRFGPMRRRVDVVYSPDRVHKAIHLIRNPMHNIIARFHLDYRHHEKNSEWIDKHPNNKEGLQAWCHDHDEAYRKEDKKFFGKDSVPTTICRGEFYKFTQWHNLVYESLEMINHAVPVLTVYYEDYSTKFNQTVNEIMSFLELDYTGHLREFQASSDYSKYFTEEQKTDIRNLIKEVASEKTWAQLSHYFA